MKTHTKALDDVVTLENAGAIEHQSPIPYYFQLSSYIEARVKAKEWRQGQVLPSEQEFCDVLGVSRTVVRQAMAELERKGLILKQNGKRSTVALSKYEGALMQTLGGLYEDAIARGQKLTTQVLKFKIVAAKQEVAQALQMKEGEPVLVLDRLRALDGEPEVLVATYLPARMCPGLLDENFTHQSLYAVLSRRYGFNIVRGFRTIEAVALDRTDARLLGVRSGSPALLLKSIGLLDDGTPLEYFVAKHRGDRSKFEVRIVRAASARP